MSIFKPLEPIRIRNTERKDITIQDDGDDAVIRTHQVGLVLEGVVEVGDPPPVPEDQHVALLLEAGSLGPLQHLPLVQDLQGEHLG